MIIPKKMEFLQSPFNKAYCNISLCVVKTTIMLSEKHKNQMSNYVFLY